MMVPKPTAHCCGTRAGCRAAPHRAGRARVVAARCSLPPVMVNSCTGKMGHAAAEALVQAGYPLVPMSFTGLSSGVAVHSIGVRGVPVQLVDAAKRQAVMDGVKEKFPGLLVVDFTLSQCVHDNAAFYASNGLPFVMGTVGGDRQALRELVERSGTYAVLASQEWRQAAGLNAVLKALGVEVSEPLGQRYRFEVVDSTQRPGRGSPSATMRADGPKQLAEALASLGIAADEATIMRKWKGHSGPQCIYRLSLADRSKSLVFKYNSVGRRAAYVQGAVEAVSFLAKRVQQQHPTHVYDINDVLETAEAVKTAGAARQVAMVPA